MAQRAQNHPDLALQDRHLHEAFELLKFADSTFDQAMADPVRGPLVKWCARQKADAEARVLRRRPVTFPGQPLPTAAMPASRRRGDASPPPKAIPMHACAAVDLKRRAAGDCDD